MSINHFVFRYSLLLLLVLNTSVLHAQKVQEPKKVEVQNADMIYYNEKQQKDVQRLIGNVVFKHENAFLYCDSAYFNAKNNSIIAFSQVHLIDNDSIHLYSDKLAYNGDTKIAKARNKVRLLQGASTLTTDSLNFDRNTNVGYYFSGGEIVDKEHTITSRWGYYYTNDDLFFAIDKVKVLNVDYTIDTDSLKFNTETEISDFFGNTEIISDSTHIFAHFGRYDSGLKQSFLSHNAVILSQEKTLKGDSIYYDEVKGIAEGFNHVSINDTLQKVILAGDYLFYNEPEEEALVTQKALAIKYDGMDSLFIHSDTLLLSRQIDTLWYSAPKDSVFHSPFKDRQPDFQRLGDDTTMFYAYKDTVRFIKAYHRVQSFSENLQSRCDSLIFVEKDSLLYLYGKPIVWSDNQQITAVKVAAKLQSQRIEEIHLKEKAFIIMQDDSIRFNQISGNNMEAHFDTLGDFSRLDIFSNTKMVFFPREEVEKEDINSSHQNLNDNSQAKGDLVGVNISEGIDAKIWIKNNRPDKLVFYNTNTSVMNPIEYLPIEETRLKGFKWYEMYRPKDKEAIFIWTEIE